MKTNYTIKNFRVFDKNGVTVEIAPLTFLVGCNSSGKSSIVKSLSLLKTLFRNDFDREHPVVGSELDFSAKPNNSLGSFGNVVRSSSREKKFSLAYEVYSSYINDDVVVELTFGEGELGNAVVTAAKISKKDGASIISAAPKNLKLSYAQTKEAFKQYLIASRFHEQVESLLSPMQKKAKRSIWEVIEGWNTELEMMNDPYDADWAKLKKIEVLKSEALRNCSSDYLQEACGNPDLEFVKSDEYINAATDKFVETGILTYYSIFDEMRGMSSPEEVSEFLKSKVKEGELHDTMIKVIDYVTDNYAKSGCSDFISYYRKMEESWLLGELDLSLGWMVNVSPVDVLIGQSRRVPNHVISILAEEPEFGMNHFNSFGLMQAILSKLVEEEPYSYELEEVPGCEESSYRVHPLYYEAFRQFFRRFCKEVMSIDVTDGLEYISSSRIQVRRMYPMEDRTEFSDAVRRYFDTKSKFMTLEPPIMISVADELGMPYEVKVSDFVPGSFMDKWLRAFRIGDRISLDMDMNGLGLLLKVYRSESDKKGMLLADMGYGVTQLFSILLQIEEMIMSAYYERYKGRVQTQSDRMMGGSGPVWRKNPKNIPFEPRTLAIEEPEIHLHPKYQSLLAEMFYEAYRDYNIQFIIETHSEYLLRKIQTLVGTRKLTPDEVSLVYVEDDGEVKKGEKKVRRIPVKEDGRLAAPFGSGFYDEADNLSLELFTNMGK